MKTTWKGCQPLHFPNPRLPDSEYFLRPGQQNGPVAFEQLSSLDQQRMTEDEAEARHLARMRADSNE